MTMEDVGSSPVPLLDFQGMVGGRQQLEELQRQAALQTKALKTTPDSSRFAAFVTSYITQHRTTEVMKIQVPIRGNSNRLGLLFGGLRSYLSKSKQKCKLAVLLPQKGRNRWMANPTSCRKSCKSRLEATSFLHSDVQCMHKFANTEWIPWIASKLAKVAVIPHDSPVFLNLHITFDHITDTY